MSVLYFKNIPVLIKFNKTYTKAVFKVMQLLSNYKALPIKQFNVTLSQQKDSFLNPLGVRSFEVKKIKRLLTGRLVNRSIAFLQTSQNPQKQFDDSEDESEQQQHPLRKLDIDNSLNFSLICKSSIQGYQIFVNFYINLKRASYSFESKLMTNYRLVKIQSRNLTRFIARYFVTYNSKLKQGSFYVNPLTKQISLFIHNHSTLDRISSLIRNPQKFLSMVTLQIQQITLRWNQCLQTILYVINRKSFEEINPTKKMKYIKDKLIRSSQMIIHSHIDAFFFVQNRGIPRFKKMEQEQRKLKLFQIKNDYSSMEKRTKPLNPITTLIQSLIGKKRLTGAAFKFPIWQMPRIRQVSMNLACNQYGGKSTIYSEIQILDVERSVCIFESGFSQIYIIDALFKREGQPAPSKGRLIKKQTQQKRYKNQVEVLKLLHNERCLFFPRYYFCQEQQYKHDIFVEYIHESSIDRYLSTKSMFIGTQTKLFFLFQIIVALRFLRDNSIVHIDIKPQNILIKIVGDAKKNVHYLIKLIDFGESYSSKLEQLSSKAGSRGFTIPYAPPELLSRARKFDEKTDVFSFGVIMYQMMFNHFPVEIMKLQKSDFIEGQYLKFYSMSYQKLASYGTQDIVSLVYFLCLKCLQPQPADRPTLDWLSIILKDLVLIYEELTK